MKINYPIKLIELFAGYGSQAMAMKKLGVPFEHHYVCEFDKYAIASYNAVHGTDYPTIDIRDVKGEDLNITDTENKSYVMFYSFPCTDLSLAGKQAGMSRDSGTRSGLLWEVERLLKECSELPQILIMENVPMIHSKKFTNDFEDWIKFLGSKGYESKWSDLNAKDFGVPQNRNRTFMVSILGKNDFVFPQGFELLLRLKDMLENKVDEKYYLSDKMIDYILATGTKDFYYKPELDCDIAKPLTCSMHFVHRAGTDNYVTDTLLVKNNTKLGYLEAHEGDGINICARMEYQRGNVQDGMSQTIDTTGGNTRGVVDKEMRIRKLTPRECGRLMGVSEEDIDKMLAIQSNTQAYKQYGNSIVVDVLYYIFKNLFVDAPKDTQMSIDDLLDLL